ncbi:alpha-L-fucosidase [Labilibaculum filiforme]|uniref:alpha-L-fucosidase n=1 Tax=Labilibaculum filiforme TaxID=1940526 RepID=A0A2N3I1Z3_9BACT|nr:alpha-L-fucosidase [Labilibaculum filiforme]PKQ64273.1 alpha-L-fucosidase [Labilibaculum filiforme]
MRLNRVLLLVLLVAAIAACKHDTKEEIKNFEPNWESLKQYECPTWFQDAKFGIYTHWGVYSVPKATGQSDWYGTNMYNSWHPNHKFHLENYGSLDKFGYKDFIPMFTAEKFNADEWADLFVEAGAQFAGPAGEHADGFSMWDSEVNPWNAADMGPKRDVVRELEKAIRKRGLKYVVSLHHSWLWGWFPTWMKDTDCYTADENSIYGEKLPSSAWKVEGTEGFYTVNPMPSKNFEKLWLEKVKEVVDNYSPDLLWFDNRVKILSETVRQKMMAYAYNHAAKNEQEFVLTFKRPDFPLGTGTVDLERSRMPEIYPEPWLTDTSISGKTWSWSQDIELYTTNRLIDDLVDIVSKNGCLLLNVAPHPDGFIPEEQQKRLREMGQWLKLNGEAIYKSRPWLIYGEGSTETKTGHLADQKFDGFSDDDIRFTQRDGQLYAIALGWPESGILSIKSLGDAEYNEEITKIELIGYKGDIKFDRKQLSLDIQLPEEKPCEHAFVFRIKRERKL